jgi:hypothetical protein
MAYYKEAYVIVIDACKFTKEEHESLQEYINHFVDVTNDFTPYTAYMDDDYSDDVQPV